MSKTPWGNEATATLFWAFLPSDTRDKINQKDSGVFLGTRATENVVSDDSAIVFYSSIDGIYQSAIMNTLI